MAIATLQQFISNSFITLLKYNKDKTKLCQILKTVSQLTLSKSIEFTEKWSQNETVC